MFLQSFLAAFKHLFAGIEEKSFWFANDIFTTYFKYHFKYLLSFFATDSYLSIHVLCKFQDVSSKLICLCGGRRLYQYNEEDFLVQFLFFSIFLKRGYKKTREAVD